MNTNRNNRSGKSAGQPEAAQPSWEESLVQQVADKARFLADRDVMALASYIKGRHGGTAFQPEAKDNVVFSVQFKGEDKEVKRKVAVVVAYAKGDYYTRFKVIVTVNRTKRSFFPCTLDDTINIIQDTANPFHYSNRISTVSEVKEEAGASADNADA